MTSKSEKDKKRNAKVNQKSVQKQKAENTGILIIDLSLKDSFSPQLVALDWSVLRSLLMKPGTWLSSLTTQTFDTCAHAP